MCVSIHLCMCVEEGWGRFELIRLQVRAQLPLLVLVLILGLNDRMREKEYKRECVRERGETTGHLKEGCCKV